jgi:hypothetical protein
MGVALTEFVLTAVGIVAVSLAIVALGDLVRGRKVKLELPSEGKTLNQGSLNLRVFQAALMGFWSISLLFQDIFEFHHLLPRRASLAISIGFLILWLVFLCYSIFDLKRHKSTQIDSANSS